MYHLRRFDATTPVDETLNTVRYIACSNFSGWHLMKSLSISERYGWAKYVGHQVYYSLIGRDYEWELMPLALDQGVGGAGVVSAGLGTVDGEDSARAAAAGRISLSLCPFNRSLPTSQPSRHGCSNAGR